MSIKPGDAAAFDETKVTHARHLALWNSGSSTPSYVEDSFITAQPSPGDVFFVVAVEDLAQAGDGSPMAFIVSPAGAGWHITRWLERRHGTAP